MSDGSKANTSAHHIVVFQEQAIGRTWHAGEWWFSMVDVVSVLSESSVARRYWSDLKRKLAKEAGSDQPYERVVRLTLTAPDGKQRETGCATTETREVLSRIEEVGAERQTTHDRLRRCEGARA